MNVDVIFRIVVVVCFFCLYLNHYPKLRHVWSSGGGGTQPDRILLEGLCRRARHHEEEFGLLGAPAKRRRLPGPFTPIRSQPFSAME